ncbi:MAG: hypothetical protein IJ834_06940 [Paludibacteraceae bacterium]|nr:hypothetical protein [Paludibacteraceae bacterium]
MKNISYKEYESTNLIEPLWLLNTLTIIIIFCIITIVNLIFVALFDYKITIISFICNFIIAIICVAIKQSKVRIYLNGNIRLIGFGHIISCHPFCFHANDIEEISFKWNKYNIFGQWLETDIRLQNAHKLIRLNIKDHQKFCEEIRKYNTSVKINMIPTNSQNN